MLDTQMIVRRERTSKQRKLLEDTNNCINDGSRSTENAIQVEFSNHSKMLYSKDMVLSVREKAILIVRCVLRR